MKMHLISATSSSFVLISGLVVCVPSASAFGNALFQQEQPTAQLTFPSQDVGVEIELPDFDELFHRVKEVSPLSRVAMEGNNGNLDGAKGFEAIDKNWASKLKWKTVESNKRRVVKQIEKIDNFQGLGAPLLRFRAKLQGPCVPEPFANFLTTLEQRKKWDNQIDDVYEAYPIQDMDAANIAMGFKYGDCSKIGVGHCITKANIGIDAREQLTMCGINHFADGSSLIWGTEMEEWHNHLLPGSVRHTRAKSHIFATALVPTSENEFDVEYIIQLDIGGKIPTWMTTPIVLDSVKKMFDVVQGFYQNDNGELGQFLLEKASRPNHKDGLSLLMTP